MSAKAPSAKELIESVKIQLSRKMDKIDMYNYHNSKS